uniref:tyrosine-type recombinase/integrase n=1 Tax=Agromyces bauzanensis TaxID=1308924 RepID=UPI0027E4F134|nr:tyrosine-type recombinase/integrase [Agromyces bauzanensis]
MADRAWEPGLAAVHRSPVRDDPRRARVPSELSVHALRHTYVTNLIEWGYTEKFVQDHFGHAYASTTAIYTSVGDDFKNRMITRAAFSYLWRTRCRLPAVKPRSPGTCGSSWQQQECSRPPT